MQSRLGSADGYNVLLCPFNGPSPFPSSSSSSSSSSLPSPGPPRRRPSSSRPRPSSPPLARCLLTTRSFDRSRCIPHDIATVLPRLVSPYLLPRDHERGWTNGSMARTGGPGERGPRDIWHVRIQIRPRDELVPQPGMRQKKGKGKLYASSSVARPVTLIELKIIAIRPFLDIPSPLQNPRFVDHPKIVGWLCAIRGPLIRRGRRSWETVPFVPRWKNRDRGHDYVSGIKVMPLEEGSITALLLCITLPFPSFNCKRPRLRFSNPISRWREEGRGGIRHSMHASRGSIRETSVSFCR